MSVVSVQRSSTTLGPTATRQVIVGVGQDQQVQLSSLDRGHHGRQRRADRAPMTGSTRPAPIPVLVAAAGSPWEARAIDRLERGGDVALARRCVDLTDLLATAGAGLGSVAVVSPALPGLDADSVSSLRRSGLGVVLVAAPDELLDGDAERMRRLGIEHLLASTELDSLVGTVVSAGADPAPGATSPDVDDEDDETETRAGRLLAVWGPAGAPGRTTVAVGLAAEVAAAGHEVLLLDVDAYGGAVGQHLGVLDEVSGLLAAARSANNGELDDARLTGLARQVGDVERIGLGDVLRQPGVPVVVDDDAPAACRERVDELRGPPEQRALAALDQQRRFAGAVFFVVDVRHGR